MPPPRQPNRAGSGNSRAGTPGAKRQILNVTARKDRFVQQRKSRALARIAVTFLAGAVLVGAVFGALYVKDRFFLENPHYNLKDLEVKTDGTLPQELIVKAAGLQRRGESFQARPGRRRPPARGAAAGGIRAIAALVSRRP